MKKRVKVLLIVSILLLIILLIFGLYSNNKKKEQTKLEENNVKNPIIEKKELDIVKNRSDYYTILGYVNSYINCLNNESENTIINILDKQYKIDNNITGNNVYSKIKVFSEAKEFKAEKMYYEINNNVRNILCLWKHKKCNRLLW